MVPAADFGERGFHAGIGLDQPRDLLQTAAQFAALAVLRAVRRIVWRPVQRLDHLHGREGVLAGAAQLLVRGVGVHAFEMLARLASRHLKLLHVVDCDGGAIAAQRARQLRAHRDGAQRRGIRRRRAAARDSASRRA